MTTSEMKKEYHFWDWKNHDHLGCRDYLLVVDNDLYYEGAVQNPSFEKLKVKLLSEGPQPVQERLIADSKKRLRSPFARVIPFNKVQAAEYVPLLTAHLVRIRYVDDKDKQQTLTLKVPPDNNLAQEIFDKLHAQVAPNREVTDEQASKWTAIRGPVFSLIFGGGWLVLAALASTTDERAWQEKVSILHAIVGWLIRFLGPVWLTIIAVVWIGASAWLLRSRLKNPPTIRVWRTT